jgi:DNA-binding Lrp family transcriptional regulator
MTLVTTQTIPVGFDDPVNAAILAVSEDRLSGFQPDPLGEIARRSSIGLNTVIERIRAMLEAGTIRRVRQTLLSTNLAQGALVAWEVPQDSLQSAFDYMFENDPFSGHVVIRTTDAAIEGARYKLWTTLKVPEGYSLEAHCAHLAAETGAVHWRAMPAKRLFALGVGHIRRRGMEPGSRSNELAEVTEVSIAHLSSLEWRVLTALKREFAPAEIVPDIWARRADEAGVSRHEFLSVAAELDRRKIIGRFSTFLEHVKPLADGKAVTRYNALFHWAVPPGREIESGREVGRHHILTHCYWREAGPDFHNVNIMGVAHGTDKDLLLAHKDAIDRHLEASGIPVAYAAVFWGGRSEIKPSEVSPLAYEQWCEANGLDPADMRR